MVLDYVGLSPQMILQQDLIPKIAIVTPVFSLESVYGNRISRSKMFKRVRDKVG